MAKVRNPLLSDAANGSLGNITFRSGRGGAVVSLKPRPLYIPTAKRIQSADRLRKANADWRDLDADTRAWWEDHAIAGSSGHATFVGCSCRAQIFGDWIIPQPVITPSAAPLGYHYTWFLDTDPLLQIDFELSTFGVNYSSFWFYRPKDYPGHQVDHTRRLFVTADLSATSPMFADGPWVTQPCRWWIELVDPNSYLPGPVYTLDTLPPD
jgi:hypothetical protein